MFVFAYMSMFDQLRGGDTNHFDFVFHIQTNFAQYKYILSFQTIVQFVVMVLVNVGVVSSVHWLSIYSVI